MDFPTSAFALRTRHYNGGIFKNQIINGHYRKNIDERHLVGKIGHTLRKMDVNSREVCHYLSRQSLM